MILTPEQTKQLAKTYSPKPLKVSEDAICKALVRTLEQFDHINCLKAIYCHIPNEGQRDKRYAAKLKAMGVKAGAPDYVFCWQGGSGFIEMKSPNGRQQDSQIAWQAACEGKGVHYALCYSVVQALDVLEEWGVLQVRREVGV